MIIIAEAPTERDPRLSNMSLPDLRRRRRGRAPVIPADLFPNQDAAPETNRERTREVVKAVVNLIRLQISNYGEEKWKNDVVQLGRLEKGSEYRQKIWHMQGQRPSARMQRAFCRQKHYVVDQFKEESGKIRFKKERRTLSASLLSVDLIPDQLVQDLGIVTFPPHLQNSASAAARTLIKANAGLRLTDTIKMLFHSSADVFSSPDNKVWGELRVMQLREPSPQIKALYPHAMPFPKKWLGTYIVTSEQIPAPTVSPLGLVNADKLKVVYFDNVFTAARSRKHGITRSDKETETVSNYTAEILVLRQRIDSWKKGITEAEKKILCDEAVRVIHGSKVLGQPFNEFKKHAKRILAGVIELRDSTGKHNPGRSQNQLSFAMKQLNTRLTEIQAKSEKVQKDDNAIWKKIVSEQALLIAFRKGLERFPKEITEMNPKERAQFLRMLPVTARLLDGVSSRPLLTFAAAIRATWTAFEKAVNENQPVRAKEMANILQAVVQISAVNTAIEHMRFESCGAAPNKQAIFKLVGACKRQILDRPALYSGPIDPKEKINPEIPDVLKAIVSKARTAIDDISKMDFEVSGDGFRRGLEKYDFEKELEALSSKANNRNRQQ